jgi:Protein of unknown function (DUF2934)
MGLQIPFPYVPSTFLFRLKEAVMEPIVATRKVGGSPIPVIGTEFVSDSIGEDLCHQIALRAYYKAEARGYELGYEIQDWLDAEAEVMFETKAEKDK